MLGVVVLEGHTQSGQHKDVLSPHVREIHSQKRIDLVARPELETRFLLALEPIAVLVGVEHEHRNGAVRSNLRVADTVRSVHAFLWLASLFLLS